MPLWLPRRRRQAVPAHRQGWTPDKLAADLRHHTHAGGDVTLPILVSLTGGPAIGGDAVQRWLDRYEWTITRSSWTDEGQLVLGVDPDLDDPDAPYGSPTDPNAPYTPPPDDGRRA